MNPPGGARDAGRSADFIIAGAPRSGTTWLYEVLDRHPEIAMARPRQPEPKFFLVDELYERGVDYYAERWFADIDPSLVAGEKSTNYLESATAAARIACELPEVRLVFSLREPADRARSNYLWSRLNGFETLDFEQALEREPSRDTYPPEQRYSRPYSYFDRGLYARHLRPYLERFPAEQLLILRYEDILACPAPTIERVHRFLGVAPRGKDAHSVPPLNATPDTTVDATTMNRLRERYREHNAELIELLGGQFPGWEADR